MDLSTVCYTKADTIIYFYTAEVDRMPSDAEIVKETLEQFKKIQRYMILTREEKVSKTYSELKDAYISLKAVLNVIDVNLTDIDKIKE